MLVVVVITESQTKQFFPHGLQLPLSSDLGNWDLTKKWLMSFRNHAIGTLGNTFLCFC